MAWLTEEIVTRKILTKKQVAILLDVSTKTVERYSQREVDPLRCHKLSAGRPGRVRYYLDEILDWIERQGGGINAKIPRCF